jgi:peptidoglycan/xylan/chitin deacetylase (PgdA/CDA1 family)
MEFIKNKSKKLLFSALTAARKSTYSVLGLFDRSFLKTTNPVFVLSYHSVANDSWRFSVDEEVMKKQIIYLHKNFDIITLKILKDYVDGKVKITKPSVVLTFDDGYKDILKLKDVFAKYKIKPALFLLANPEKPNWKELGSKREFLTTREIKSLMKLGWEIGCHSATHANLATLSQKELTQEIITSKKTLERNLGVTIPYFAYPRGKYTKNVVDLIQKAKYTMALTMDDGFIKPGSAMFTLPRVGIDRTHSFAEFTTTFSPSVVRLRKLVKNSPAGRYL